MKTKNLNSGNIKKTPDLTPTLDNNNIFFSRRVLISLVGLIIIILIAYSPIKKNTFLTWDDNLYVVTNQDISNLNFENVKNIFSHNYVCNYIPITILSYAIDYNIGELDPAVYTITNLLIHILNSICVFLFVLLLLKSLKNGDEFKKDSSKPIIIASITSTLFAVHPFNVESVAWISERKNLLFTFFFLLSLICYINYLRKEKKHLFYYLSIFLFLLSSLSKATAISLPLCIVALDYLFQRKLFSRKVIIEKIPFFILAIIFGVIAIVFQGKENISVEHPVYQQVAFASYGFINYLFKLLIPLNFKAIYPYPETASLLHWVCFIIMCTILFTIYFFRKQLSLLVIFGIVFYLVNIILLLQLLPIGEAIYADRYIYISSIGFFLLVAVFITRIATKFSLIYIIAGLFTVSCMYLTHERVKVWNNSLDFWSTLIETDPNISVAWLNRGQAKHLMEDNVGAFEDFNKSISLKPSELAYNNRAWIRKSNGDLNGAIEDYNKAIRIKPDYGSAYFNRGVIKLGQQNYVGALDDFNAVIRLDPKSKEAYNAIGVTYSDLERWKDAIDFFSKAIAVDPSYYEAINNKDRLEQHLNQMVNDTLHYAIIAVNSGKFDIALEIANNSLHIIESPMAYQIIGRILYQRKDMRALTYIEKANALKPGDSAILNNLFHLYLIVKDFTKAEQCINELKSISDEKQITALESMLEKAISQQK
jgi:protein O-mannosyl-transferase